MAYGLPALAAAASNVNTSSPGSSIDGYTLKAGNRVLLTHQSTGSQNGVWIWKSATSLKRPTNVGDEYVSGNALDNATLIWVQNGNTYAGTCWGVDRAKAIVVDTTAFSLTRVALPPVQAKAASPGTNVTLSAPTTSLDGVSLIGNGSEGSDIILLKNQTTPSQNGLYWANTGGALTSAQTSEPLTPERVVRVSQGTVNAHTEWAIVTQLPIQIGTTAITFSRQLVRPNVRDFGATGNGFFDDSMAINTALSSVSAAGGALLFPPGTYRIGTGTTIPATVAVEFEEGAMIAPATGIAVTINGPVRAHPTQQIFVVPGASPSPVIPSGKSPPAVTVSGAPTSALSFKIQIVTGGTLSAGISFQYSVNNGITWLPSTPQNASSATSYNYVIPGTGITVTFPSGTYTGSGPGQNVYTWNTIPSSQSVLLTPAASDQFSVKWWGAKGDALTDDTAALLAAFAAPSSVLNGYTDWTGGWTIRVPAGTYLCSREIALPPHVPLVVEGAGNNSSFIEFTSVGNGIAQHFPYAAPGGESTLIRDIGVLNQATNNIGVNYYSYRSQLQWIPNTPYGAGTVVSFPGPSNRLLLCTTSGTSGAYTPFGTLWAGAGGTAASTVVTAVGMSTITVASTVGFQFAGTLYIVDPTNGLQLIQYKGLDSTGTEFTECTGALSNISVEDSVTAPAPYPYITGTPAQQYPMVSIEMYMSAPGGTVGGAGGLPPMAFRWCTDGLSYATNGTTTTSSGQYTYTLGSTGLSVTFPQAYYGTSPVFYNSPPLGTGFSSIVGTTVQDNTVTWTVIDGGSGLLFENGGQIQVERCQSLGFACGVVVDGAEVVQVRDCQIAQVNGVWVVANNERNSAPFAATTVTSTSNGVALPTATIYVSSTVGFPSSGLLEITMPASVYGTKPIVVQYTGIQTSPYAFTGCTGGLGTLATGNIVQCGVPAVAGQTNDIHVTGCQIWHTGIAIADSGGTDHTFKECNFEGTPFSYWTTASAAQTLPLATINVASTVDFPSSGVIQIGNAAGTWEIPYTGLGVGGTSFTGCSLVGTGAIGGQTVGYNPSGTWYFWCTEAYVVKLVSHTGEGGYGGAKFSTLSPFTGARGDSNDLVIIDNCQWTVTGQGAAVECTGYGATVISLQVARSYIGTDSTVAAVLNGLGSVGGIRLNDNLLVVDGGTQLYDTFAVDGGHFAYDQSDASNLQRGFGINCVPGHDMDIVGSLGVTGNLTTGLSSGIVQSSTVSTTVASTSNGVMLPVASGIIYVAATTGFPSSGVLYLTNATGTQIIPYTGLTGSPTPSFTGCTGGVGAMATNNLVTTNGVLSSSSLLSVTAGLQVTAKSVSATYTVDSGSTPDYQLLLSGSAFTITLPAPTPGRVLKFKNATSSATSYTIKQHASETIDGATSYVLNVAWGEIELTSNGTNWFVTGSYNGTVI